MQMIEKVAGKLTMKRLKELAKQGISPSFLSKLKRTNPAGYEKVISGQKKLK